MPENCLIIDGTSYISSSRAAELFGYTKDYVGQLARSGKIQSQLIGRTWYVDEDSIRKHKLTVHYTLTKPKKPRKNQEKSSEQDENTNDTIDISEEENAVPIHELIGRLDTKESFSPQESATISTKPAVHESYEPEVHVDLFPRPVKPSNHDALVRSEFVYEPDHAIEYTHSTRDARHPRKQRILEGEQPITVDSGVRVIRSEPKKKANVPTNEALRTSAGAIDGVVITQTPRTQGVETQPIDNEQDESESHDEEYAREQDTYDTHDEYDDSPGFTNRPSRLIPIVGAFSLFTILSLLYLVL